MRLVRTILYSIVITGLAFGLSACAQPNWYKAGKLNYAHQQYNLALPQLLWSAQLGDASAQYAVGYMYYNGLGTPQDDILAYHWFLKATKGGNQKAAQALQQIQGNLPPHINLQHRHNTKALIKSVAHKKQLHHSTPVIPAPGAAKSAKNLPVLPAPIKTQ